MKELSFAVPQSNLPQPQGVKGGVGGWGTATAFGPGSACVLHMEAIWLIFLGCSL